MKKFFILLSFLVSLNQIMTAKTLSDYLIPTPKQIEINSEQFIINYPGELQQIQNYLGQLFQHKFEKEANFHASGLNIISIKFITDKKFEPQHYKLTISPKHITLKGGSEAALYYAKQTLYQIIEYALCEQVAVPCLSIEDYPDFEHRAYMLDISRDKVPTMQTLYRIVDMLSAWKINELQLYTEHTFAYKNHQEVWKDASPMTAEEIRLLDKYCSERFIDLVPNQNSFGHAENWLKHTSYQQLAECPDDCATKWGKRKLTSFDPTNPNSLALMKELYAELLPNFTSQYFNIGCDETVELGLGRSKTLCDSLGTGIVYLNYLKQLNTEVNKLGKKCQFWGDIISNHKELIHEIPDNMTALAWGYNIGYNFDTVLTRYKDSGVDFYVCPGTSSWRSLIGRDYTAFVNIKEAATKGKQYGAKGFMLTDWGDYGHWQPLSVSYPAILIGCSYAWTIDTTAESRVEFQLNHYVFQDETQQCAKAVLALGNAYREAKIPEDVANVFHLMLHRYRWTLAGNYQTRAMTIPNLQRTEFVVDSALAILQQAKPHCYDAHIIMDELNLAADLAKHSIHLGIARINAPKGETLNIPEEQRQQLAHELQPLIERHRQLWTIRNRPGGLDDSAGKLEEIENYYINKQ